MTEVRNNQGKLVCCIDKNSKKVEIVLKGYVTTIIFKPEGTVTIKHTKVP